MNGYKVLINKASYQVPSTCELSTDDRLRLIANIIIDRIQDDIMISAKAEDEKHD